MKEEVAKALAERVIDGECLGLGSGSTAELAVVEIGKRIKKEGLRISGLATSRWIASVAAENGILVLDASTAPDPDWAFDGADEVDPALNLIKGNGAAMLSEKIVAKRAGKLVVVITKDKLVENLGEKFAVPVEVIPESVTYVKKELLKLGAKDVSLRMAERKYGPVITEQNNFVLDAKFVGIEAGLESELNSTVGVVENGLFFNATSEVLVATKDGIEKKTV